MTDKLKNTRILVHTAIFPWNNYTDKEVIDMDWLSGNSGNQLFRWAMLNLFKKTLIKILSQLGILLIIWSYKN